MSNIYTDPPQSRNEAIIKSTIDGTQYTDPPQSRMEDLLLDLKEAIEGGGGGGTTVVANPEGEATDELEKLQVGNDIYGIPKDYAELDNKPQINGETLSGNKTASELGLQPTLDGAQTVSGNPITVTDAEPMNAESVVVELEPKQDLHGYDAPWVGGSGKNKLNYDAWKTVRIIHGTAVWENNGVKLTATGNDCYTDYDYNIFPGDAEVSISEGETVIMSWDEDTDTDGGVFIFPNGSMTGMVSTNNADSKSLSYTATAGVSYVTFRFGVAYNGDVIAYKNIMIRKSTESADFAPYSNICPITGYSEVNVERVGKNWLDKGQTPLTAFINGVGEVVYSESDKALICKVTPSTRYTLSFSRSAISGYDDYQIAEFENAPTYGDYGHLIANQPSGDIVRNFETSQDTHYVVIKIANVNQTNYNATVDTAQLEQGNQATTYEPYQGNTYTIDLDGTKYGGTLDVTEGGFIDDHGYATINYASLVDGLFRVQAPNDVSWSYPSCKCSCLEVWDTVNDLADNYGISYDDGYFYMNLPPECGATESAVQTWLQNNPIGVVYVTRDVTEESTTPTDIPLLENTNNISTDGTNITLKYQPNNVIGECKAYTDEQIEKVLPPLPTTDGTYHLSCEVTSGVGVLSWVSDS